MKQKIRKAVLPVAGWGTRFLPATKTMPKEMLCVVNKPVIQYAVEEALEAGIEEIIFVTGRGKEVIDNHFDRNFELEDLLEKQGKFDKLASITEIVLEEGRMFYTRQARRLGLGHAIYCAKSVVADEPFAVLLPDDIMLDGNNTSVLKNMVAAWDATQCPVVLAKEVSATETKRYGVLDTSDQPDGNGLVKAAGFVEKPQSNPPSHFAIMGRYILTPRIFDFLAEKETGAGGEIQLTDAMHKLAQEQDFYGLPLADLIRLDCGDIPGYIKANLHMALQDPTLRADVLGYLKSLDLEELK